MLALLKDIDGFVISLIVPNPSLSPIVALTELDKITLNVLEPSHIAGLLRVEILVR